MTKGEEERVVKRGESVQRTRHKERIVHSRSPHSDILDNMRIVIPYHETVPEDSDDDTVHPVSHHIRNRSVVHPQTKKPPIQL